MQSQLLGSFGNAFFTSVVFLFCALIPSRSAASMGNRFELPLLNSDNMSYGIRIRVGSQRQVFTVMVDTGSQFLWIPSFNATGGCRTTTAFDPSNSSTFVSAGLPPFRASYGSGSFEGLVGADTVCLGGDDDGLSSSSLCAANVSFALGTKLSAATQGPFDGILGLKAKADLHRLPLGLALDSRPMLDSVLRGDPDFRIAANPSSEPPLTSSSSGGVIALGRGVVTRGKKTIPTASNNDPFDWLIHIAMDAKGSSLNQTAILDVGTSFNYLPTAIANAINKQIGCTTNTSTGLCVLECPSGKGKKDGNLSHVVLSMKNVDGEVQNLSMRGTENIVWLCGENKRSSHCRCASAHIDAGANPFWSVLGAPFFRAFDVAFLYPNTTQGTPSAVNIRRRTLPHGRGE